MRRVFNLIIVDESGSMSLIKRQAFLGLNETLETVQKMQELHADIEQHVTLELFDSSHCHFLYDNVTADHIRKLKEDEYRPGGSTPLYDAIGKGINKVNAQTEDDDNVLVTIITDGEENSSTEYNLKMVKTLIGKLKKQNWTFTLIGTDNLDVEGMAAEMSIDDHLTFRQDDEGTKRMFADDRKARTAYNTCIGEGLHMRAGSYFDNDEKKNKRKIEK